MTVIGRPFEVATDRIRRALIELGPLDTRQIGKMCQGKIQKTMEQQGFIERIGERTVKHETCHGAVNVTIWQITQKGKEYQARRDAYLAQTPEERRGNAKKGAGKDYVYWAPMYGHNKVAEDMLRRAWR